MIDNCMEALSAGTLTLEEVKDKMQAKYSCSCIRRIQKPNKNTSDRALVAYLLNLMDDGLSMGLFYPIIPPLSFLSSCGG